MLLVVGFYTVIIRTQNWHLTTRQFTTARPLIYRYRYTGTIYSGVDTPSASTNSFICTGWFGLVWFNLLTTCLDPQAHMDEAIYPVSCVYQTISIIEGRTPRSLNQYRKVHKLDNFNVNL